MANKKISELNTRTPSLTDLMLVGDPSTGYSYKATISSLSTLLEANIALNDLSDVTITSPTAGQVLSYNGTAWVNDTNGITGSGTTNYVTKFTSSSAIGNSQIFDNGTSVGIATATPSAAYRLDIEGNVRVRSGQILAFSNFNNTNTYQVYNAGGSGAGGEILVFTNGTTERMRLDASGNLGLGVTPSAWSTGKAFEINSAGNAIWSYGTDNLYLSSNAYFNGGWKYGGSGKASNYTQFQGQHFWEIAGTGTAGNAISFTQAMTLDASGNLMVGGTTASNTSSGRGNITISGSSSSILNLRIGATNGGYLYHGGTNLSVFNEVNGAMEFGTNDSTRMTITNAGNVGIGTTAPTVYSGYTTLAINNATNGGVIDLMSNGVVTAQWNATSSTVNFNSVTNIPMVFATNSTERMRITSGGNVGIGTTSPAQQMEIKGAAGANTTIQITSNNSNDFSSRIFFADNVSQRGYIAYSNFSNFLAFGTNSSERMRITSDGELLINTTTDAGDYKLQVNGSQSLNGILDLFDFIGATTNKWNLYHYNDNTFRMNYNGSGSDELILSTGGNLELTGSIKTAAPSGGTAKPFKIGAAATVTPTSQNRTIEIEIDGTTYYLTAKTTND